MIEVQISYFAITEALGDESRWHFEMPWAAREVAFIKEELSKAGVPLTFTIGMGIKPARGELTITHHHYERVSVYQWKDENETN